MTDVYNIVRFYQDGEPATTRKGLTLDEAKNHCKNPETSSVTATDPQLDERGAWFDSYQVQT